MEVTAWAEYAPCATQVDAYARTKRVGLAMSQPYNQYLWVNMRVNIDVRARAGGVALALMPAWQTWLAPRCA